MEPLFSREYSVDTGHTTYANVARVSPDGKTIATCSSDATIRIFNADNGQFITALTGHTKGINTLDFLPINSDIIALGLDDLTIRIWSISLAKCINVLKKHTYHVTAVRFTSKGNVLILASADENITAWDLMNGRTLHTVAAHSDPILSICLSPDDSIIVLGGYDGMMRLFDTELGQCIKTLTVIASHGTATALTADVINHPISNVIMSPNGKYIFSSSLDGYIRLWEYLNNKVCKTYGDGTLANTYCCETGLVTATKLPLLVLGSESQGVVVFDVQTRQVVFTYVHPEPVMLVQVINGGDVVALSRGGQLVRFRLGQEHRLDPVQANVRGDLLVLMSRDGTADVVMED